MPDITLINPIFHNELTVTSRMPPLGLLYVASYLESKGIEVEVYDPVSQGEKKIEDFDSKYIGISCMSNQLGHVKEIVRRVKENNSSITTVVGGVHASVRHEELINDKNIDIVVANEGEKAMYEIMNQNIKSGIVFGEIVHNLDELPIPARHLVNMNWYLKRDAVVHGEWTKATDVFTSRGCPFSCIFCINSKHAIFGKKVRFHSPEYVENEVTSLVSDYGLEGIAFFDDNFIVDQNRAIEICKRIKKFDLKWSCLARADSINRKIVENFSNSGCVGIHFGVESGSQKVLDSLNKCQKVEDIVKAFALCEEFGIKTLADILIGCPNETREDIRMTDKLLERIRPSWVQVWHLTPYPETVLFDQAVKFGWIKNKNSSLFYDEPQMEINFTSKELTEIKKDLSDKHNRIFWSLRPYIKNVHFIRSMLQLLMKRPSLLFNGREKWRVALREEN